MKRSERRQWASTGSLDDLGAMTVKWLHGEVGETPGHMGPPDPETADILEELTRLNRRGFVTTNSQPGLPAENRGGKWWPAQYAWVQGYTRPPLAGAIEKAAVEAGLVVEVCPVAGFRPWWRRGDEPRRSQLDLTWGGGSGIGDGAWDDVEESVFVDVYDPEAGRNDLLWETLVEALSAERARQ